MAASIEARVPFVDHRLAEWAFNIPIQYKLKWKEKPIADLLGDEISEKHDIPKYILKKMLEPLLPERILYRKKMGFPVPLNEWLGKDFIEKTRNQLCKGQLVEQKIVNSQALEALLNTSVYVDAAVGMKIWMLVNLEVFLQKYFSQ